MPKLRKPPGRNSMPRIAYFDCFSGASGDMILGALLDAGFPFDVLKDSLSSLDLRGYDLSVEKVKRSSITATRFSVIMDPKVHQHSRSLADILKIIDSSKLPAKVKQTGSAVFQRLGEGEGGKNGGGIQERDSP